MKHYFQHILCTQHQLPITRVQQSKQINSSKRTLCDRCPGEGVSIFYIYQILDSLQGIIQPIHKGYKTFREAVESLRIEIQKIINQFYSFIEGAINKSEFELSQIEKLIQYQKNCLDFTIEDLETISDFIYSNIYQESSIYKSIKKIQEIQQSYSQYMIQQFENIIQLIKGTKSSFSIKKDQSFQNVNNMQSFQNPDTLIQKPPLPSKDDKKKKLLFEMKNEYKTSEVKAAIFNKNGDILFEGQFPLLQFKNLEIKQIDINFKMKNQSIQEMQFDDQKVTALAYNEENNQLYVGYEKGDISTFQYEGNIWKFKLNFKAHNDQVNFLIVNSSNTEVFLAGIDDIIKCYDCKQGISQSNKVIKQIKNISDIQINKESDYFFVIGNDNLHVYRNQKNEFSQFQQITLSKEKVTCMFIVNQQIYIGSNYGAIYIYELKNGSYFDEVLNQNLIQKKPLQSIKYVEEPRLLIALSEDQVSIFQIDYNNQFNKAQSIEGQFSLICFQNYIKKSQFILYCYEKSNAQHYIMQNN